jgi:hypothetical protein
MLMESLEVFVMRYHGARIQTSPVSLQDYGEEKGPEPSVVGGAVIKEGTLASGMARLERFIAEANVSLKSLITEKNNSIEDCKELSKYCGESGGERVTSTLLGILSQFATHLSAAVEKHDNRKDTELRKEAAATKKTASGVLANSIGGSRSRPTPSLTPSSSASQQPETRIGSTSDGCSNHNNKKKIAHPFSASSFSMATSLTAPADSSRTNEGVKGGSFECQG